MRRPGAGVRAPRPRPSASPGLFNCSKIDAAAVLFPIPVTRWIRTGPPADFPGSTAGRLLAGLTGRRLSATVDAGVDGGVGCGRGSVRAVRLRLGWRGCDVSLVVGFHLIKHIALMPLLSPFGPKKTTFTAGPPAATAIPSTRPGVSVDGCASRQERRERQEILCSLASLAGLAGFARFAGAVQSPSVNGFVKMHVSKLLFPGQLHE